MGNKPGIAVPPASRPRAWPEEYVTLTPELIEEFLKHLLTKGRTADTLQAYSHNLSILYRDLPGDKHIGDGTLERWRDNLLAKGYAPRTVNLHISTVNSLLEYCGHRELQLGRPLESEAAIRPELTRSEYLRLLSTARQLNKEREYLLIKVFAAVGLSVRDLPLVTAEAVGEGKLRLPSGIVRIPDCLRAELLDYIGRENIRSGPLFVTRAGTCLKRTSVTSMIQRLCRDAQVPEEKANPRCLRRLYQTTQAGLQANLSLLMEQAYDRLLETEQLAIGWNPNGEASGF